MRSNNIPYGDNLTPPSLYVMPDRCRACGSMLTALTPIDGLTAIVCDSCDGPALGYAIEADPLP